MLFTTAKMLLPTNDSEERYSMKMFYQSQFPIIFILMAISIFLSIMFNIILLNRNLVEQSMLILFLLIMVVMVIKKPKTELLHQGIAILLFVATILSILLEENAWVIK